MSDGNLTAISYICPLGTPDGSNETMALTSHGLLPCMRLTSLTAALSGRCVNAVGMPTAAHGRDAWPWVGDRETTDGWNGFRAFTFLFFNCLLYSGSRISTEKPGSKKRKRKKQQQRCSGLKHPRIRKCRFIGVCKKVGGRRFRVIYRRYRHLGQIKRKLLLTRLRRARWARIHHYSSNQSQSSNPMHRCPQTIQWICGFLGIRVGEARHPGPGDKKRKATGDEAWTDVTDGSLAQALLQVLQTHRGQADKVSVGAGPPASKKGKGGPTPVPRGESKLARVLLQTLQAAITNRWTGEMVAQRLVNKITRHVPAGSIAPDISTTNGVAPDLSNTKKLLGEKLFVKVQPLAPQHVGKVTSMILETPVKAIKGLLANDVELEAKVKEVVATLLPPRQVTWADKVRPKPTPPVSSKAKGKGKQKGAGPEPTRVPRFAVKINTAEWSGEPCLTTLNKLEQALSQGEEPPGNLIVTADPEVTAQAKSLWAAFERQTKKLTVATVNNKPSSSASVCVWWKHPGKSSFGSQNRIQLQLSHIGSSPGPAPIAAVVTNIPKPQGSKMVTVRFLAPAFYRKHVPGVSKKDDPATVIGCLASAVGCQASLLTGGRWEVASHPHGKILIGHVKVAEELAQKLAQVSGIQALFVALNHQGQKEVAWLPRAKQPAEAYFRQSLTRAQAAKMPLVSRQGGGSDLGVVGMSQRAVSANLVKTWEFHGCPRHWTNQEVSEFLEANKWTQIEVLNKIRRGPQHHDWLFKAKAAPAQEGREHDFWYYTNRDESLHLTLAPIRPSKVVSVEQVPGPRKRWFDTPAVAKVAATQLDDLTMDDPPLQPTDEKERSPRRQKAEKALDPDKVFLAQNPNWEFVDNGGAGLCLPKCCSLHCGFSRENIEH